MATVEPEPIVKAKKAGVRERSKQERQDRIMMAARKLFAEHGYDATTLRDVAEMAGPGPGNAIQLQQRQTRPDLPGF